MTQSNITGVVEGYCQRLPEELKTFAQLTEHACLGGRVDGEYMQQALNEAHRLCGSAQCMGFGSLADQIAEIERQLQDVMRTDSTQRRAAIASIERNLVSLSRRQQYIVPGNSTVLRNRSDDHLNGTRAIQPGSRRILSRQRVLFADDDASVRGLAEDYLLDLGVQDALFVASGKEALAEMEGFRPTVIISDWQMQPIDGFQLFDTVRSGLAPVKVGTPLVFLTAQKEVRNIRRVIRKGIDFFMIKPFTQDVLACAMLTVLQPTASGRSAKRRELLAAE